MKIIIYFWIILISTNINAKEIFLHKLDSWLIVTMEGEEQSDVLAYKVSILDKTRTRKIEFPSLIGEIIVSEENNQLFSCESNSILATEEALAFDLKGNQVFSYKHHGYLRNCGITEDKKIYWLQYNLVEDINPHNVFIALSSDGKVIHKESFQDGKNVTFRYLNRSYSISIPDADLPG
ncbi:MAG: hypothetical protein OEY19_07830 [Gammaproteobacteria bacterium]|nr:hypothetical protein [Gammaproteobacteria bacterium]MDH5628614.1 hypothetical protein [Gammaproteobacteria bacterium]